MFVKNSLLLSQDSLDLTNTFFQRFKINISLISHHQAIAEHLDLPNTDSFQSKDVALG
jgi:hypothetical protein